MLSKANFKKITQSCGYTVSDVSKITGISLSSLRGYLKGKTDIPSDKLIALSDALDCSCDFLLGRSGISGSDWAKSMNIIEKAVIEKKLSGKKLSECNLKADPENKAVKNIISEQSPIAVFPYNLVDALNGVPSGHGIDRDSAVLTEFYNGITVPFSKDQIDGLHIAIDSLTEREQKIIKEKYVERKTLDNIAHEFNITRERVRQIEAKALRKLKHPSRFRLIRDGYKSCQIPKSMKDPEELAGRSGITGQDVGKEIKLYHNAESTPIENLDLSVRSYNCLRRSGFKTVKDLVDFIKEAGVKWTRIRNFGEKSVVEVTVKLKEIGINVENIVNSDRKGA